MSSTTTLTFFIFKFPGLRNKYVLIFYRQGKRNTHFRTHKPADCNTPLCVTLQTAYRRQKTDYNIRRMINYKNIILKKLFNENRSGMK